MASHPYKALPTFTRWSKSVAGISYGDVDPVVDFPFQVSPSDRVATAGSCFAQHIARHLSAAGFHYYVPERAHDILDAVPGLPEKQGYGIFSARYGNIYTSRQLLQLFKRAFGLLVPVEQPWVMNNGSFVDPFRPTVQPNGFATLLELELDRAYHLSRVVEMFRNLDVFVFTLGLTEMWYCKADGMALPVCPGVAGGTFSDDRYGYHNLTVDEVVDDFSAFVELLREINPAARIILTVSPVPLAATAQRRHVLVSTTLSKSILRVAADIIETSFEHVAYFPSYEIITSNSSRGRYYSDNLRDVTEEGVSHVMRLFMTHAAEGGPTMPAPTPDTVRGRTVETMLERMQRVIEVECDEALIEASIAENR